MTDRHRYDAAMRETDVDASRRRAGAASRAKQGKRVDAYHRVRDIRAEVAAEDERRGRCTW